MKILISKITGDQFITYADHEDEDDLNEYVQESCAEAIIDELCSYGKTKFKMKVKKVKGLPDDWDKESNEMKYVEEQLFLKGLYETKGKKWQGE